jgi:nitrous oxide reductase accessory protein NosL
MNKFFMKSVKITLASTVLASVAIAKAPSYNPQTHFYQTDTTTGYNIGMSLYELKNQEMQIILKKAVDDVNRMSEQELFKFSTQNKIFKFDAHKEVDLKKIVKTYLVEEAVEKRNRDLIEKMNNSPLPQLTEAQQKTRAVTVTDDQLIQTSISINYSPAIDAHPELKQKYDPKGNYGFCFLRAHYYANTAGLRGLVKESIKKVFLVGTMMPLGFLPVGIWQFHVAAAVRGEAGAWKVMDNHLSEYQKEATNVTDWYKYYNKWLDTEKEYKVINSDGVEETVMARALFLYFTNPEKVGASSNAYNAEAFYGVDLNNNGQLEGKEIYYNDIFRDVDSHIMAMRPGVCDPDRYQPLPEDDERCSSPAQVKRTQQRKEVLNQWKSNWEIAMCGKSGQPNCSK